MGWDPSFCFCFNEWKGRAGTPELGDLCSSVGLTCHVCGLLYNMPLSGVTEKFESHHSRKRPPKKLIKEVNMSAASSSC